MHYITMDNLDVDGVSHIQLVGEYGAIHIDAYQYEHHSIGVDREVFRTRINPLRAIYGAMRVFRSKLASATDYVAYDVELVNGVYRVYVTSAHEALSVTDELGAVRYRMGGYAEITTGEFSVKISQLYAARYLTADTHMTQQDVAALLGEYFELHDDKIIVDATSLVEAESLIAQAWYSRVVPEYVGTIAP